MAGLETAAALDRAVVRGEPFAAELATVKALGAAAALAPLEPFAASGLPSAGTLARELVALTPALAQAAGGAPRESGWFDRLAANADGILEQIAQEYGVSTFEVVRNLPDDHATIVPGEHFGDLMEALTGWGEVLFIVHTPDIVLECEGTLPPGTFGRGYYNLHGDSPIGGHIKAENCRHVAFVARETLALFGAERCLFGSNFPIEKLWTSYAALVAAHRAGVPAADHDRVFNKTARRVYRLGQ